MASSLWEEHSSASQFTPSVVAPETPSQALAQPSADLDDPWQPNDTATGLSQPQQRPSQRQDRDTTTHVTPHFSRDSSPESQPQERPMYPWSTRFLLLPPPLVIPGPGIVSPTSPSPPPSSPPPFPRYGHALPAMATADGELYLFGGLVRNTARNDLYLFSTGDLSATLVQTAGEVPSPRVGHASAVINNTLIVWGGDTRMSPMSSSTEKQDNGLYLLNLVSKEWSKVSTHGPSPSGRYGHTVTVVGTKFFVFGGQIDDKFMNDLWSFDLDTLNTQPHWELCRPTTDDRPAQRTGHVCVTYGDRIAVFGGTDGQFHYNDTWTYDVNAHRWIELRCIGFIPPPREGHAAAVVDDIVYVFGGRDVSGRDLGDLAACKLHDQRWYIFQNMGPAPSARSGHAMASTGSKIFVLGGESYAPAGGDSDDHGITHVLDTRYIRYPKVEKQEIFTTLVVY